MQILREYFIEQFMKIKYLGVDMTTEINSRVFKGTTCGAPRNALRYNSELSANAKIRIWKTKYYILE